MIVIKPQWSTTTYRYDIESSDVWTDKYDPRERVRLTAATVEVDSDGDVEVTLWGQPLNKNGEPHATRGRTTILNDEAKRLVLTFHAEQTGQAITINGETL